MKLKTIAMRYPILSIIRLKRMMLIAKGRFLLEKFLSLNPVQSEGRGPKV